MDLDLKSCLDFALDAAWQAGRITLSHFQTGVAVERKQDASPVTIADRQSEKKLRELVGQYWPEHGIIGEEFGQAAGASGYTWILDPIDGTKSFVQGVPIYAVLVALTQGDSSLVGVVHFPALDETVYAVQGGGCYWNGRRVHTSAVSNMKDAVLLASEIVMPPGEKSEPWQRLLENTYIHRTWGDAYGYALVATGRAEIMLDSSMKVWDAAPLQVVLNEAGGTFTDWKGKATIHGEEGIATNGLLYEQVMKLVKG